jgi:hypothetical protein
MSEPPGTMQLIKTPQWMLDLFKAIVRETVPGNSFSNVRSRGDAQEMVKKCQRMGSSELLLRLKVAPSKSP